MNNSLEIFSKMANEDNKELKMIPFTNIKNVTAGNGGWGSITLAIPNDCVVDFLIGNYVGGLLFCNREEFNKFSSR